MLFLTIIAFVLVSSTYAKYSSSASGADATVIANWSFKVNGEDITILGDGKNIVFDLFNTIKDTETGEDEENVAEGLIAPGTMGSFDANVEKNSTHTITLTGSNEILTAYDGTMFIYVDAIQID